MMHVPGAAVKAGGEKTAGKAADAKKIARNACIQRPYVLNYFVRIATVQIRCEVCAVAFFNRGAGRAPESEE